MTEKPIKWTHVDTIGRGNSGILVARKTKKPTKWPIVAKINMGILETYQVHCFLIDIVEVPSHPDVLTAQL